MGRGSPWSSSPAVHLLLAVLLSLAVAAAWLPQVTVAVSCGDAVSALAPCGGYLLGTGEAQPTVQCCGAVHRLNSMAQTVQDRRAVCQCLKDTGPSFGVRPDRAGRLPGLCKVKLPIPISVNVDCSKI